MPENDETEEETSKNAFTRQWFYSGLAVYVDKYIWVTKSETAGENELNDDDDDDDDDGDAGAGESTTESSGGEYQKSSRVIDFCIFKAWDGERVPLTKVPFSDKIL